MVKSRRKIGSQVFAKKKEKKRLIPLYHSTTPEIKKVLVLTSCIVTSHVVHIANYHVKL